MNGAAPAREAALAGRLGLRVVLHGVVGSTMDAAAADPGPIPVLHLAGSQSEGRGRRGRRWESPPGNLYATIAWPDPDGRVPPGVLAAIQVAWAEWVQAAGGPRTRCKWPNDGFVGDRKWAGALAARPPSGRADAPARSDGSSGGALLLGLGANLEAAPADPLVEATALRDHWSPWPGREAVAIGLLEAALDVLRRGPEAVRERLARWSERDLWRPGGLLEIEAGGARRTGLYAGITPEGLLRLETDSGVEIIAAGDAIRPGRFSAP